MAPSLQNSPPSTLTAGETLQWVQKAPDTRADQGWVLTVTLTGPDTKQVTAPQYLGGTDFLVVFDAATTKNLPEGGYQWTARAALAGAVYLVDSGVLSIAANPDTLAGDTRGHNERMLIAIEALIEGRIPADIESYSVAGKSIQKMPMRELLQLRSIYQAKVARARNGGTLPNVDMVFTRG